VLFRSLAELSTVEYKCFIARKYTQNDERKFFLRKIQSNPRSFAVNVGEQQNDKIEVSDVWELQKKETIDKPIDLCNGWLLKDQIELQIKFFNKPLKIFSKDPQVGNLQVNLSIVPMKISDSYELQPINDFILSHLEFNHEEIIHEPVALKTFNSNDYYSIYRLRTNEKPEDLIMEIRVDSVGNGHFKLPQNALENSNAIFELALFDLNNKKPSGYLKIQLLLIRSFNAYNFTNLKDTYVYNFNRACIPVGHRGLGKTFDADLLENIEIIENTISSFDGALKKGAQMVEFDVVLTKDKWPIVYHDFSLCIQSQTDANKYIDVSVNQLTYNEIKEMKVFAHKILKKLPNGGDNQKFTSKHMFPTLREMFNNLDEKLGFNLEIKYPQDLEDASNEADSCIKWLDRNEYTDVILNELFNQCKIDKRCVILTTFDPFLCSMLRIKQNRFPVLFLTNGLTKKWVPYLDFRTKNTKISAIYAKAENFHGVVVHSEELIEDSKLFEFLKNLKKDSNFLVYTWGDDLNEISNRKLFQSSGVDAIIYDRINESIHSKLRR